MPIQKTRKGHEIDVCEVWRTIKVWSFGIPSDDPICVVIEEPGGSKSAKAASSMAGSFHALRAIVEILGLKLVRITPQQWQRPLLKCGKGDTKKVALQMAKSLYPSFNLKATERCTTPHSGIVDALLIGTWANRNHI